MLTIWLPHHLWGRWLDHVSIIILDVVDVASGHISIAPHYWIRFLNYMRVSLKQLLLKIMSKHVQHGGDVLLMNFVGCFGHSLNYSHKFWVLGLKDGTRKVMIRDFGTSSQYLFAVASELKVKVISHLRLYNSTLKLLIIYTLNFCIPIVGSSKAISNRYWSVMIFALPLLTTFHFYNSNSLSLNQNIYHKYN